MDIIDLKNRILSVNDEIDYLKNEINEIVNDTSFTEEEKRYEIDILNQKISKKLELLNKYVYRLWCWRTNSVLVS